MINHKPTHPREIYHRNTKKRKYHIRIIFGFRGFGVEIGGRGEPAPENGILVGSAFFGDAGFTVDCDYPRMIALAETEARKLGANTIKITQHDMPDLVSTCHRLTVQFYLADLTQIDNATESESIFDSTATFALLHVYRPRGAGALVTYTVHLGTDPLCTVKHNSTQTTLITTPGPNEIWAKTESRAAVPISVELGREYYLRCGISMGLLMGRPTLSMVDKRTGATEFNAIKDHQ